MFRSIVHRSVKSIAFSVDTQKLGFCTFVAPFRWSLRDVNDVKIVGTLISDSFTLQCGSKSLTVRTNDTPTRHSNHNILLTTELNFSAGQRVYVRGKLRSRPVCTIDDKILSRAAVKVDRLYVLDNECGFKSKSTDDRNHVEILGNVVSEVLKRNNHCTFSVATHYNSRNPEDGTETVKPSFHRVYAYNTELFQFIEDKLEKGDCVLLSGSIDHKTHIREDGKKLYSSYIVAEKIYRM